MVENQSWGFRINGMNWNYFNYNLMLLAYCISDAKWGAQRMRSQSDRTERIASPVA